MPLLLLFLLVTGVLVSQGDAAVIVYTSRPAWLATVSGVTTETFAGAPLGVLAAGTTDLGLVDVTIDANAEGSNEIVQPGAVNGTRGFNGDIDTSAATFNRFTFPFVVSAFGADFASTLTGDQLTVEVGGITILFSNHLSGSGNGFLGVVSTVPFSQITFRSETLTDFGEDYSMDDLSFGTAIPEPSGLLLVGGALALLLLRKRR